MTENRMPHSFRRNIRHAWYDIKRVWKAYIIGSVEGGHYATSIETNKEVWIPLHRSRCSKTNLPIEIKGIILEIYNGIFRRGQ